MNKINYEINTINNYVNELENKVEENNLQKNKIRSIIKEIFSKDYAVDNRDLCEILVILGIDDIDEYKHLQREIKNN